MHQKIKEKTDREQIVELVRKWGDVNTDGILDASCKIFSTPHIEGIIGYRIEASNAVVLGDPVCAPENKGALALAFQHYCEEQKLGVVYTIVSEEFSRWAVDNLSSTLVEFGEKFVLNPADNPMNHTGPKAVRMRNKVSHALRDGLIALEYTGHDESLEEQIIEVSNAWLNGRKGLQVYLSHIDIFNDRYGKRWFYAKHGNKIVGVLMLNQLQSKNGWLLNNIRTKKEIPPGASELLVITALQTLEKENCQFVLAGPAPLKELGKITGISSTSETLLRWLYKGIKRILHLDRHLAFWDKFQPKIEPSYVLFPKKNLRYSSIKALLQAYNTGL